MSSAKITWEHDIRHFFTAKDVTCMQGVSSGRINLHQYESVKKSAQLILDQVKARNMPPPDSGEVPWSAARVQQFEGWIAAGFPEH
jgi:hypothetical protein